MALSFTALPIAVSLSVLTNLTDGCAYGSNCDYAYGYTYDCTYWLCLIIWLCFASFPIALHITVPIALQIAVSLSVLTFLPYGCT